MEDGEDNVRRDRCEMSNARPMHSTMPLVEVTISILKRAGFAAELCSLASVHGPLKVVRFLRHAGMLYVSKHLCLIASVKAPLIEEQNVLMGSSGTGRRHLGSRTSVVSESQSDLRCFQRVIFKFSRCTRNWPFQTAISEGLCFEHSD
jgi:hypothetical protein